jgi:hypothetical protein
MGYQDGILDAIAFEGRNMGSSPGGTQKGKRASHFVSIPNHIPKDGNLLFNHPPQSHS